MVMRKRKNSKKRRKWKSGLKAGCLALGLATAWGGEARGDVILQVTANLTKSLTDAFIYFNNNVTSGYMESLGTLSAGQTITKTYTHWGTLDNFTQKNGARSSYVMVGLYDDQGSPGVAVSFPNADPISGPVQWADIFGPSGVSYYHYTEAEVIGYVNQASAGTDYTPLRYFLNDISYNAGETEYGNESTIVCFSNPTSGGVMTVDVLPVPEPAAWMLFVGLSGAVLLWRRDLFRG